MNAHVRVRVQVCVCMCVCVCVSACGLGDNTKLLLRTVGTVVGTAVKTVGTVGTVYMKSSL